MSVVLPKLLIVDDEAAILRLLSYAFTNAGYEVATAMTGEQALEICETGSFDVVLSDVQMPGIDGFQTVRRICARQPDVVKVLMSGCHVECTGEYSGAARYCTWIQKPFRPEAAISIINELLAAPKN